MLVKPVFPVHSALHACLNVTSIVMLWLMVV